MATKEPLSDTIPFEWNEATLGGENAIIVDTGQVT